MAVAYAFGFKSCLNTSFILFLFHFFYFLSLSLFLLPSPSQLDVASGAASQNRLSDPHRKRLLWESRRAAPWKEIGLIASKEVDELDSHSTLKVNHQLRRKLKEIGIVIDSVYFKRVWIAFIELFKFSFVQLRINVTLIIQYDKHFISDTRFFKRLERSWK